MCYTDSATEPIRINDSPSAMMMMPITQSHRQVNPSRGVVAISVITVGITRWIQEERSFDAKVDSHNTDRDLAFCYLAYLELWILIHLMTIISKVDKVIQLDKITKAYISGTSNECDNNLSSDQDGDFT
nr:hypothetical protein CFP56_37977 [Quercus suber]